MIFIQIEILNLKFIFGGLKIVLQFIIGNYVVLGVKGMFLKLVDQLIFKESCMFCRGMKYMIVV